MKVSPRVADIYSGWAEEFYNPDLPYHNWGHAEEVMTESLAILNGGGRWTRHVNRPLLQVAAAWHDAGHDHEARFDHESSEHYSAHLMRQRLKCALPSRQLGEIEETILGTRFQAARGTMASIALHYGDVGNMAHEPADFADHTRRLWAEYGQPEWKAWRKQAEFVIEITAAEAGIELPRIGVDERPYIDSMYRNLLSLSRTTEPAR